PVLGFAKADHHRLGPAWPLVARDRNRGACKSLTRRRQQLGRQQFDRWHHFRQVLAGRAVTVPGLLVAPIDKRTEDEAGSRQPRRGHKIADDHEVGREVYDGRDGAIGDRLGQRTTDRKSSLGVRRRLGARSDGEEICEIDPPVDIAEIIPGRFMAQIKQGTCDQRKGRQTRRGREFAKYYIVYREVEGGDDNPKRDGFGDRLLDRESHRDERRLDVGPDRLRNSWFRPPPEA